MAKQGVSCTIFISSLVVMALAAAGVGLLVYFWVCPERAKSSGPVPSPTTSPPSPPPQPGQAGGRLPRALTPTKYALSLQPYFPAGPDVSYPPEREFTFDGNVNIFMECVQDTDNITLHMYKIDLNDDSIELLDITDDDDRGNRPSTTLNVSKHVYNSSTQQVTFFLRPVPGRGRAPLLAGRKYELRVSYTGQLEPTALAGFYPSSYVENGETHWLVATQMEPTDARRVLPCFDEPSYKASFEVNLTHPSHMKALANGMETDTIDIGDGWNVTSFKPTPRMSSYLLAVAVCAFKAKESYTEDKKTLFRVWARPSLIDQADMAVEAGPKVLDYYSEYFNISFPLEKQDMLAIPDFSAGAMENWGLVTYRESALLFDEKTYASSNRQRVAIVIAHELAHQWFGDLVTMAWWNDLWLNEGFARYMEFVGGDEIAGGAFRMDDQFALTAAAAMLSDSVPSSHPIVIDVETPDEINAIFDDISYSKGAAILRMLEYTISNDTFQAGLRSYLSTHAYQNAVHEDLWSALTEAIDGNVHDWDSKPLNVSDYMNPWIKQAGYPVLTVNRNYDDQHISTDDDDHDHHSHTATITQERYMLYTSNDSKEADSDSTNDHLWYVPVWYRNGSSSTATSFAWLQPNQELVIPIEVDTEWILANDDGKGYYRVNYDEQNWRLLQNQLSNDYKVISKKNRAQMLFDALALARAGYLSYEIALDTCKYLINETEYIPLRAAAIGLAFLEDMLILSSDFQYFKAYIRKLLIPLYNRTGWDDTAERPDDVLSHLSRSTSRSTLCRFGYGDCLEKSTVLFQQFVSDCKNPQAVSSNCSNVHPNLRRVVYCAGASNGPGEWWDLLWDLHRNEQFAVEKENLMYGLSCTRNPSLLTRLLDEAINPNSTVVRRQDARSVFSFVGYNDIGRVLLWPYLVDNWPTISSFARTGGGSVLTSAFIAATQSFNTAAQVKMLEDFARSNSDQLGSAARTLKQQIERVNANVEWMQKHRDVVVRWFKERSSA